MQDAGFLGRPESGDHLNDGVNRLADGKRPIAFDSLLESPAVDEFHDDDRGSFDLSSAVDIHTVWMINRCGEPSFTQEAGLRLG